MVVAIVFCLTCGTDFLDAPESGTATFTNIAALGKLAEVDHGVNVAEARNRTMCPYLATRPRRWQPSLPCPNLYNTVLPSLHFSAAMQSGLRSFFQHRPSKQVLASQRSDGNPIKDRPEDAQAW